MRNLQEQVKKAFCYQKLFRPFTAWINCSSDLKNFANSWHSASNFKRFFRSLERFFLTVGQNNFCKKNITSTLQPLIKSINWLQPAMYLFKLFFLPASLFLYNNVYRKLGECWVCFCFALLPLWVEKKIDIAFLLLCNFSCDIYILYSIHSITLKKWWWRIFEDPFFQNKRILLDISWG